MKLRPAPTTFAATVISVAISVAPLHNVFSGSLWAYKIIGGALVAALVAAAIESYRPRLRVPAITAITFGGAAIWSVFMTTDSFWSDPQSLTPWRELRVGVFEGWTALLDDQFPLREERAAEIFAATIVWIVTATAIHILVRRKNALAVLVGTTSVLWLSAVAALPRGPTHTVVGVGAGCAILLVVASMTGASDDRWRAGRAISLSLVIGTSGLAAILIGQAFPAVRADPIDPRTDRGVSVVELEVPDILADFSTRLDESVALLVEQRDGGSLPELRLRLQVYDVHDGERWLPSTDFGDLFTGPQDDSLPPGEVITLNIRAESFTGPWVPLPDQLLNTDLNDIQWSADTQTALTARRLNAYSVTGVIVDRSGLEGQESARESVDPRYTEVPVALPDTIRQAATLATSSTTDALGANNALSAFVHSLGRNDQAAPGHSIGRLRDDLAAGVPTGAEQLASLHALMARTLGHPARVVVGYVTTESTVLGSDLHIWTEIAFPDRGWVSFDPVPERGDVAPEATTDSTTTTLAEDTAIEAQVLPRELDPGETAVEAGDVQEGGSVWRYIGIALAVLSVALVAGLPVTRYMRRRLRRYDKSAGIRVLGAWAELIDRLREAGAPIARTTTVGDIVFMAREMDTELGDATAELAEVASPTMHGPAEATDKQAMAAWESLARAEQSLRDLRGVRATVARLIDPRVLRHRAPLPPESRITDQRGKASTKR